MDFKFLIDENIEHYQHYFSDFGDIKTKAGRAIQADDVADRDVLLVRSVTQVNQALIAHSAVKFVGSATIGTDHLSISALEQQQIHWCNASGCNAQAVAEYVIAALFTLKPELFEPSSPEFCLGIVGLGNVGCRLAHIAQQLGWNVQAYDPFVQSSTIKQVDWHTLLQSDAISIHVPLTKTGDYPTYHLFNEQTFQTMNPHSILINSARGEVIAEHALLNDIRTTGRQVVLDVFEHEPIISEELLSLVRLVTPHIAGYSLEGKLRGTEMLYQQFCDFIQHQADKTMHDLLPNEPRYFNPSHSLKDNLKQHLSQIYNIQHDDDRLRQMCKHGQVSAQDFDNLRKHYPLRREWSAFGARGERI